MKCRICRETAVIALPRHNSAFCKEHFLDFFKRQVQRAIREFRMFSRKDRILVCVSGGKDSLTLWHILHELNYDTTGLYIDLGIGEYSKRSRRLCEDMAKSLGRELKVVEFSKAVAPIKDLARAAKRTDCSTCGVVKRYYFNKVALEEGYNVVATGHNLDDEAARLLGNLLRWQLEFVQKQYPVLEEEKGLKRKVKPLCRLTEQEIAAYAFLNRITYLRDECPMSHDSTSLLYKEALNRIELQSPGTKHFFYLQFLYRKRKGNLKGLSENAAVEPDGAETGDSKGGPFQCRVCGLPSSGQICSFCKITGYLDKSDQTPYEHA